MRGRTNKAQKIGWLLKAGLRAGGTVVSPRSPVIYASALPEVQFLVDAASDHLGTKPQGRTAALLDVLANLDRQVDETPNSADFAAE